ncbi:energy transducer TonB [Thiocystis violacea]|uniref:energy transducer TonB n=1 Tax=Thiocystis violacea TaxID=13725 RepID=UPI001904CA14|nr:energy transducer TonB [Thiocystis violacea]MBK1724598.1 energy transducer TonB [Thiocystis violacea]
MTRTEAPLPSLPLWGAALIALSAEAALLAGLSRWPQPRALEPLAAPIEVSLVSAPALADSAALSTSGDPSDVAASEPEIEPEPPAPEPEPVAPVPPMPIPVRAPDPVPAPVAVEPLKSKPKPVSSPRPQAKPKPKPKPTPKPKPKPKTQPKPVPKTPSKPAHRTGDQGSRATASAAGIGTGTGSQNRFAGKGAASSGSSSPAAYLSNPSPSYPDAARRQRQEGTVHLRVLVSTTGRASEVRIARSSGVSSLDQAAVRAVRRSRFKPARQNGQPISAWVQMPIRFKLNQSSDG